jgi:hypothetical protein
VLPFFGTRVDYLICASWLANFETSLLVGYSERSEPIYLDRASAASGRSERSEPNSGLDFAMRDTLIQIIFVVVAWVANKPFVLHVARDRVVFRVVNTVGSRPPTLSPST